MATKIVMYTKHVCPHCKRAKHFLGFAPVEIELEEVNADEVPGTFEYMSDGLNSFQFPTFVFENGNVIRGFDEGKIMTELGL
ncbi:glutaredoxin family protein [Bacillus wiedmannii]|uniref:glutaredoxin family protein n=1 Tax=Bacillus wiedmannii TaxID=1890302 RepID=UPI003CF128DA